MGSPIAVVGLGALFPGAKSANEFWRNILAKTVSIRPATEAMLERDVFYRPELATALNKQDKSYTQLAGWIDDLQYDTVRRYKIPPSVAEHMDGNQHAALYVAGQALANNTLNSTRKERVAVIFGNGMIGTRYGDALYRTHFALIESELRKNPLFCKLSESDRDELLAAVSRETLKDTIPISEDSAPGVLPNIIAARIASVYDFHGPSFTVDAACASVLAAVISGMQGLQLGEYDAVLCGGADMPLKQLGFILFSALNALSANGSYPFDKRADGFVMAQGAGAVILKRLEDAVAAGDKIYAVITGWGQASDGKGKYIAAPNAEWQAAAIEKALRMADYSPDTVEMVEAHGTATKVGDVVEVQGLKQAWARLGATGRGYCGLTSVKSNIGHLKSAAGIAGLIKAALALDNKMLPPTAGFEEINPKLELAGSPFYIIDEARPWTEKAHPRRANVSSFGFGGADYHLALEEYRAEDRRKTAHPSAAVPAARPAVFATPGAAEEIEVVFFSGKDEAEATEAAHRFAEEARSVDFGEACLRQDYLSDPAAPFRLALVAGNPAELLSRLEFYLQNRQAPAELLGSKGVYAGQGEPVAPAEIALMFPGQASQYLGMFRELGERYDVLRTWLRRADAYWQARHGEPVSAYIYPAEGESEAALDRLRQTQNAHPAIFITSFALHELLRQMGLEAGHYIGHSLGEITALAAAGFVAQDDALRLVEARGYAFADAKLPDRGKMISVAAPRAEAEALARESGLDVHVANVNSPRQTIIAGPSAGIDAFKAFLEARHVGGKLLFVSHAFHTPLMKPVAAAFHEAARGHRFRPGNPPVMMNHTGLPYPTDAAELATLPELLRDQILAPVDFARSLQKLRAAGARLFVEVGPGAVLSGLAKDTLEGTGAQVLTANHRGTDDVVGLRKLLAGLFAQGVPIKPVAPAHYPAAARAEIATLAGPQSGRASVPEPRTRVVYSGVAIGLPGSWKESFRDDNFEMLFSGHNLIERLTDGERQRFVDLQVTKLIKDEGGPTFRLLTALDDVIQLAGKIGRINPVRDYRIDEKIVENMSSAIAHGVAAGYEALADAAIPLVREHTATTTGRFLPGKLALPPQMQDETGVIFANGFPLVDPVIREVSRYVAYQYGSKTRVELMSFYESLITRVKDATARKLLTDWYALYYSRLTDNPGEEEVFRFNHHFMTQISAQANNLLAFLLNARGPNFQMNAACSSTSNAITIAEDFIRRGRVKRMLVVGADDASSPLNFPLLGAGFLCTGAATSEADLSRAAVPFDRRRNGMIVGAGAVGIVLEAQGEAEARGLAPVAELLGTHSFNTGKHVSQIDPGSFSRELDRFLCRIEQELGLRRDEIARQAVYISHETYTPPRGGCSQTEAESLRAAFGESYREIIVGNTKGMTGHTMGASIEDAVAARALQDGKCPPVVNLGESDPLLGELNLWRGGTHDRTYALKMSAGFGAQGHFALLRKAGSGSNRIAHADRYAAWLRRVTGNPNAETERIGRLLVTRDSGAPVATQLEVAPPVVAAPAAAIADRGGPAISDASAAGAKAGVLAEALRVFAEVTKYSAEMLDPDMEMEADLGIDTVKQATILSMLGEKYLLERDATVQLSNYPTIRHLVDLIYERGANVPGRDAATAAPAEQTPAREAPPAVAPSGEVIVARLADLTGYPPEMLEPEMEFGADLGISGEKRAAVAARLREALGLAVAPVIGDETTVGELVKAITSGAAVGGPAISDASAAGAKAGVLAEALRVFAEVTKYSAEMLDPDMEMEADLGIDTVKQATILSMLGEKYLLERDATVQLSNYPTIRHLVDLIYERGANVPGRDAATAAPAPVFGEADGPGAAAPAQREEVAPRWASGLSRQVPALVDAPRGQPDFDLRDKSVWVLFDAGAMAEAVSDALRAAGAVPRLFSLRGMSSADIAAGLASSFAGGVSVDALVDLTHVGATATDWTERLFLSGEARFAAIKPLDAMGVRPQRILCVTGIDGSFGLDPTGPLDPWYGALAGFYKSLRKEWNAPVRVLDVEPGDDPQALAALVVAELQSAGLGVEVGVRDGRRRMVRLENREWRPAQTLGFSVSDTFLISGGASGVTARIARALAEVYPANFIIVDIAQVPANAAELAQLDEGGWERVRAGVRRALAEQHEKVTPAMINREVDGLMRGVEAHSNLEAIRALGRPLEYIACDVRDRERLTPQLSAARRKLGPITVIVHGAGMDASHLIAQKSVEEFRRVFTVKAEGALMLSDLCESDPLRAVVVFGSVAGRFGNAAQLDYAAANDFAAHWARSLRAGRPDLHAVTLVWSGWKDVGIAWRNDFVRRHAENVGLNFIEVEQGIEAFMAELTARSPDAEVVLHCGLDGFLERDLVDHYLPDFPLIDRVATAGGRVARSYRRFSTERDAMLDQHRLGETPILPAVGYAELAVEHYALLEGKQSGYLLRDQTFPAAFKLFRKAARELFVEAEPHDGGAWRVDIKSAFRPPKSDQAQIVLHSSAVVSPLGDVPDIRPQEWAFLRGEPARISPEQWLMLVQNDAPEHRINVGPLFNEVLREPAAREPVVIYPEGVIYPTYFPLAQLDNARYPLRDLFVNPCFLDSIYQLCAANLLVLRKRVYLPWHVDELGIVDPPRTPGLYRTYAQIVEDREDTVGFDIAMMDGDGGLRYYARNARFRLINL